MIDANRDITCRSTGVEPGSPRMSPARSVNVDLTVRSIAQAETRRSMHGGQQDYSRCSSLLNRISDDLDRVQRPQRVREMLEIMRNVFQ
jgi:hypothetical protein